MMIHRGHRERVSAASAGAGDGAGACAGAGDGAGACAGACAGAGAGDGAGGVFEWLVDSLILESKTEFILK